MNRIVGLIAVLAALCGAASAQKPVVRENKRFHAEDVIVMRIQFSPAGDRLLTASGGGEAALWSLQGDPLGRFTGQRPPMFAANFSPNGETIVTTGYDGSIRVWSLRDGHLAPHNLILAAVTDAVYCGAEDRIAFSSDAGVGRLLQMGDKPVLLAEVHGPGTARRVACSPSRGFFATTFDNGEVRTTDFSGQHHGSFQTGQKRLNAIALSPDGRRLLTGSTDGTAKLWTAEGRPLVTLHAPGTGWVNDGRFSPDGRMIAVASDDGHVRLYDATGTLLVDQVVAKARATTVAFSGDGSRLAVGTSGGEVVLYGVAHE